MRCRTFLPVFSVLVWFAFTKNAAAQIFTHEVWEQKNLFTGKVSQLYYELNVGINVRPQRHSADFVYLAFGYGKPTRTNAWRKFTPERAIPSTLTPEQQQVIKQSSTDFLHAGKIGAGWNHWFNHIFGMYTQVGWGYIFDLSKGDELPEDITSKLKETEEKRTFIYNTVPIELGMTLNLWKHCHVQVGLTYQWKEIPLLTVGLGYAF